MSKAKRVVIWGWSIGSMTAVFDRFIEEDVFEVALWITPGAGWRRGPKHFSYMPEIMLDEVAVQDKHRNSYYMRSGDSLNSDLCKFMDMYSRVNYSKGMDYHEHVNLFHLYYSYFKNFLASNDIDAVLFMGAPHVGVDYVLYLVAQELGISTILTFQTHVENRFFCVTELQDYGVFETSPVSGEPITLDIPKTYKKNHSYMVNARHKRGIRLHKLFEELLRIVLPNRQPISLAGAIQNFSSRVRYVRAYSAHVVSEVNLDRKFVYFPLQMQPELTTSTLGGEYSDQLLAVEKISEMIPDDWFIYVKENPKQSSSQRDKLFFERMSRINNCLYLPETIDTYDLIHHSEFVAAITGTVCWEAISGGKPALLFGVSWYMGLPGVTRYSDEMVLSDITGIEFTHEELVVRYNELMCKSIPGEVGMQYPLDERDDVQRNNEARVYEFYRKIADWL